MLRENMLSWTKKLTWAKQWQIAPTAVRLGETFLAAVEERTEEMPRYTQQKDLRLMQLNP